jgi:hypothetical protein
VKTLTAIRRPGFDPSGTEIEEVAHNSPEKITPAHCDGVPSGLPVAALRSIGCAQKLHYPAHGNQHFVLTGRSPGGRLDRFLRYEYTP